MTRAQWLFEFHAIQKKEKSFMDMITGVLGLKFGKDKMIPLSLLMGRPEAMKHFFQEQETDEAVENKDFDAMSERLASGELDEMFAEPTDTRSPEERWQAPEIQAALSALGVKND